MYSSVEPVWLIPQTINDFFFTIGIKHLKGFTDDSSPFTWCPKIIRFYNNGKSNISVVIEQKIICKQNLKG